MGVKKIPVSAAKKISKEYNCDHVIIIGWSGDKSWWATYGANKEKCKFTAGIAENLKECF